MLVQLLNKSMRERIVGIRQLHRDLTKIMKAVSKGDEFVVMRNSKPVFRIMPLERHPTPRLFTLKDLKKLQFHSGEKDLSKKIDEIVYGDI